MLLNRLKCLLLIEILEEMTDEDNPMSAAEICEELGRRGAKAERKAIYRDIAALTHYGYDIIFTRMPKPGYFIAGRTFELAEVKMLIDAVQATRFITPVKTRALIEKLGSLTSKHQANAIDSYVYIKDRVKPINEEIYYNIDEIHKAILAGKKVRLLYTRRIINGVPQITNAVNSFIVSPYAMIWSDEYYYLVGNCQKYDNLIHLRMDRMRGVKLIDEDTRPAKEVCEYEDKFNVADYISKTFNMAAGRQQRIELRCSNWLIEQVIDRFGEDIPIRASGVKHFVVSIEALNSKGLISWIMQFGQDMEVLLPLELRNDVRKEVRKMCYLYKINIGKY